MAMWVADLLRAQCDAAEKLAALLKEFKGCDVDKVRIYLRL
jgi:hypothetical protein